MTALRPIIQTAAVLALLSLVPMAHAQTVNPDTAAQKIRDAMLEVDRADTPAARVTALEFVSYHLGVLERLAIGGRETARQRPEALLRQLAEEGVQPDLVTYWTVVTRMASVATLRDADAQITAETSAYSLLEAIRNPAYRAGSIYAVGRAFAPLNQTAARRAVDRLLELAPTVEDAGERTAAANLAAKLAAQIGGLQDPAVTQAVGLMSTRRARGYAWHAMARQALAGTEAAKADDAQLAARAKDALAKRDYHTAIRLALCLSPSESKERPRLLTSILETAIADANFDVAQRAASAFTDEDDEEAAVQAITARVLERGGAPARRCSH